MDNRDFLPYLRVAKLPDFNPSAITSPSRSPSFFSWLYEQCHLVYRFCYVYLHDLILSSIFGCLTLNEKLYVAIHENDIFKARQLLSHGASPSYLPVDNKLIFSHLIRNPNRIKNQYVERNIIESILACDSMLYMAVSNNNCHLIKELIKYHNYGLHGQHTEVVSLCLAVKRGYTNIVEYLIDHGNINPNDCVQAACKHCKTQSNDSQRYQFPLYHACRENHFKLVEYLIEKKNCDINQLTTNYETCLHGTILGAIENRFDSPTKSQQRYSIVKYLLSLSNCNLNLGLNPLCISLAHDNFYDYTNLLVQSNCDVNRLGWNRFETCSTLTNHLSYLIDHPLNICLQRLCQTNGSTTIVDHSFHKQDALKLINHGSNIYAMYEYGPNYPFLLAVQTGELSLVKAILKQRQWNIQLNIMEPLICACTKTYHEIVKILIQFGFNPNTITIGRDYSKLSNPNLFELNSSNFLTYIDTHCTSSNSASQIEPIRSYLHNNSDQQITPFLALCRMSTWIFHPDKYRSTIQTLENLIYLQDIDFQLRPNRLAFYYSLIHEHYPFVYYCLQQFCPIFLPFNTIDFSQISVQNHFNYTLFHIISVCCRLTENTRIRRTFLDSYAKTVLRIHTYDRISSMKKVLAYIRLWLSDEDFLFDQILYEHIISLPYINDIFETYNEHNLRSIFGVHYQRIIERKPRSKPIHSLKHICRLKIRHFSQASCERRQINLLKILTQIDYLPKTLQCYLFYTDYRSTNFINHLINKTSWNDIAWM